MNARGLDDVIATIAAAPFGEGGWNEGLFAIADALDGWAGQMIAQSETRVYANSFVNMPDDVINDYVASGAADPTRNPRIAAAMKTPLMRPISEQNYLTEFERSRYPIYKDFHDRYDAGFLASVTLAKVRDVTVAIAVIRSRQSGDFDPERLKLLGTLAPHVRAAFDVQMAVEAEAVNLTLGALEDFSTAALVCDVNGRLVSCSPAGEAFLRSGGFLKLCNGMVRATDRESGERLESAIRLARSPRCLDRPTSASVVLIDPARRGARTVKVAAFPRHSPWGLVGGVLLAIEPKRRGIDATRLQALGLTVAEAEVAIAINAGRSVDQIAETRGVSRETVRSQLKSVYAKLEVHNGAQLVARLSQFA